MRGRFIDCDILDLSNATVNLFQEALIKNGVDEAGIILDTAAYKHNDRLDEIANNYVYDEDAEDIMSNELEFI